MKFARDAIRQCLLTIAVALVLSTGPGLAPASAGCTAAPRSDCTLPFTPHKSTLSYFQTGGHDPDDVYEWKWRHGAATTVASFGTPPATAYAFCIYDGSPRTQPVVANTPDDPSAWISIKNGWGYLVRGENAFRVVRLHADVDGKANAIVHGNSDTLTLVLPFELPVVVQLQTDDAGCWETDFPTAERTNATNFKARD
jgi:hypothetical protein